jgi:hypothetical protein
MPNPQVATCDAELLLMFMVTVTVLPGVASYVPIEMVGVPDAAAGQGTDRQTNNIVSSKTRSFDLLNFFPPIILLPPISILLSYP